MNKVAVIGSGFSGLAAATMLAHHGFDVSVFEKNASPGGRARKFEQNGFTFDMGPSWYWMPDVFEKYFNNFNTSAADFYRLVRLDPSYRVFFGKNDYMDIPAGIEPLCDLFESLERGSARQLIKFLNEGKYKYETGIHDMVYKPGLSVRELLRPRLIKSLRKLHVFQSMSGYVRKFFTDPRIIKLLEFPVLFLGASPQHTPALYSLMNYADIALGTWYPMGGMYTVVESIVTLAREKGVKFKFNTAVQQLELNAVKSKGIWANDNFYGVDYIVAGADYQHVEQRLIPEEFRKYSPTYWNTRVLAPSCLLYYIGLTKRVNTLRHHTLFFDEDFTQHAKEIYETPTWPTAPQFYVSCPSRTDPSVCPAGCENLMILVPVAAGLQDEDHVREKYFTLIMNRLENLTGERIREHIIFKRSYAHNDFAADYNAFKGNAYGLANTIFQTANFKPSIVNRKIANLFYTGQLTVPGPGVPPALISGQVVAKELIKRSKKNKIKTS